MIEMTAAAKKQKLSIHSTNYDNVHDVLKDLRFIEMVDHIKAHIEARPDIDGDSLMKFTNELGRIAWSKI